MGVKGLKIVVCSHMNDCKISCMGVLFTRCGCADTQGCSSQSFILYYSFGFVTTYVYYSGFYSSKVVFAAKALCLIIALHF